MSLDLSTNSKSILIVLFWYFRRRRYLDQTRFDLSLAVDSWHWGWHCDPIHGSMITLLISFSALHWHHGSMVTLSLSLALITTFLNDYNTFTFTFHYSALQKHLHHQPSVSDSARLSLTFRVTVYYRIQWLYFQFNKLLLFILNLSQTLIFTLNVWFPKAWHSGVGSVTRYMAQWLRSHTHVPHYFHSHSRVIYLLGHSI